MGVNYPTHSPVENIIKSSMEKIKPFPNNLIPDRTPISKILIGYSNKPALMTDESEKVKKFFEECGLKRDEMVAISTALLPLAMPKSDRNFHTMQNFTVRLAKEMALKPESFKKLSGFESEVFYETIVKLFSPSQE